MNIIKDVEDKILSRKWFYPYVLPSGRITERYVHKEIEPIHETRLKMMFSALEPLFKDIWQNITCLDLACHEGYFAHHLATRGCRQILGIDAREQNVRNANLIRQAYGHTNLQFRHLDLFKIRPGELERFDVVLMFGLLYHLENPIGALRIARNLTKRVCLVETQIAPGLDGVIDWGCHKHVCPMQGSFAVIDQPDFAQSAEASLTGLSLVPSKNALLWIMNQLGFSRCEVVPPLAGAYEQLASGKRILVAGNID